MLKDIKYDKSMEAERYIGKAREFVIVEYTSGLSARLWNQNKRKDDAELSAARIESKTGRMQSSFLCTTLAPIFAKIF